MKTGGELHQRLIRNARRLSAPEYRAPQIFAEGREWPGDWQGRTMLALCSLYRGLNEEDPERKAVFGQLREILEALPQHCNRDGYFGEPFDGRVVNEQQVSGNSWFLRGLCEAYRLTGDEKILERLDSISRNFLIPLGAFYDDYPLQPRELGGVGGHLQAGVTGRWRLSSDVGCAFMMLDGITQTCKLLNDAELKKTAARMIEAFSGLDVVGCRCQTHATLSATRGILRFYGMTGEVRYLTLAERMFARYLEEGSTVNYANFNWFGRPDSWTEPCAVVDSLILALKLFGETGNPGYLRLVNRIYANALLPAQRINGGAGCETCLSRDQRVLKIHLYEAYFCCSMRLAEGLYELTRAQRIGEKDPVIGFWNEFESGEGAQKISLSVREEGEDCGVLICRPPKSGFRLYVPEGCKIRCEHPFERSECFLIFSDGLPEKLEIRYQLEPFSAERKGRQVFFLGDRLLTEKNGGTAEEGYRMFADGRKLTPLANCFRLPDKGAELALRQKI